MQRVEILRDIKFITASTLSPVVVVTEEYFSNGQITQGNTVNATNVRAFLNDEKNELVSNSFISYLTGSTLMNSQVNASLFVATPYFREIFYDDEKLTTIFNEYYDQTVLRGVTLDDSVLTKETINIPASSGLTYIIDSINDNLFQWTYNGNMSIKYLNYIPLEMVNNTRIFNYRDEYIPISEEDSYYIPVELNRSWAPVAQLVPDLQCENIYEITDIGLESQGGAYYGASSTFGYSQGGYGYGGTNSNIAFYSFYNNQAQTSASFFLSEFFATKKYYEYSAVLDLANFIIANGFVITGSFSLSKQGTIYRKGYSDLDIVKFATTPEYVDISSLSIPLAGFNTNEFGIVTKEVSDFIDLFPSQYITRVEKVGVFTISSTIATEGYRVYIGQFPVDVYTVYEIQLFSVVPGQSLLEYKANFITKSVMGREKDLNDIKLFKPYETIKTFEKDMFIDATNSIVQCFVDLNDQDISSEKWLSPIRSVSFSSSDSDVAEGIPTVIYIELDRPALGNEEVTVVFNQLSGFIHAADLSGQFQDVSNPTPRTISFFEGSTKMGITIEANTDLIEFEGIEYFKLSFENLINLGEGELTSSLIHVIDTTIKREVYFIQDSGVTETIGLEVFFPHGSQNPGYNSPVNLPIYNYYIDEPDPIGTADTRVFQIRFTLDDYSVGGVENIGLHISANGIQGLPQVYNNFYQEPYDFIQTQGNHPKDVVSIHNLDITPDSSPPSGEIGWDAFVANYKVNWDTGQKTKTLTFEVSKDDRTGEGDESFYILLGATDSPSVWEPATMSTVKFNTNPRLARVIIRNTLPSNFTQKFATFDFQNMYLGLSKLNSNSHRTYMFFDNDVNSLDQRVYFRNWNYIPNGSAVYDPSEPITNQGLLGKSSVRLKITNKGETVVNLITGFTEQFTVGINQSVEILQSQLDTGTFDELRLSLPANYDWVDAGTGGTYYDKAKYEMEFLYLFHPTTYDPWNTTNIEFVPHSSNALQNNIKINGGTALETSAYTWSDSIINRQYSITYLQFAFNNYDYAPATHQCPDRCDLEFNQSANYAPAGQKIISNGTLLPWGYSKSGLEIKFIDAPIYFNPIAGCSGCTTGTTLLTNHTPDPAIEEGRLIPFILDIYEDYIYEPYTATTSSGSGGFGVIV